MRKSHHDALQCSPSKETPLWSARMLDLAEHAQPDTFWRGEKHHFRLDHSRLYRCCSKTALESLMWFVFGCEWRKHPLSGRLGWCGLNKCLEWSTGVSQGGSGCRMRMWPDGAQGAGGSACDLGCSSPCLACLLLLYSCSATLLSATALSSGNPSSPFLSLHRVGGFASPQCSGLL